MNLVYLMALCVVLSSCDMRLKISNKLKKNAHTRMNKK
jgi:hypothetical protein